MPTFSVRSPMPVSARALYDWHARPGAFERLAPPWQRVEVVEREGDFSDLKVTLRMYEGPVPIRWVARHRDVIEGRQFVDEQVEGPFGSWVHTHRFLDAGEGSVLEDEVRWEGTLASLGTMFSGGVDTTLARLFAFRHARTRADLSRQTRPLRFAIAGSRGLLGDQLVPFLTANGHSVRRLVRGTPKEGEVRWDPARGQLDPADLADVDVFVHLSGEPISTRWTEAKKREIVSSRVESTRLVAETLAKLPHKPALLCASATGFYGDRGDEELTEASAPGTGFLPEVCTQWEAAADPARAAGLRVVHLRTGVVLSARGGALGQLLPPFRLGGGGVVGSGRQWFPWIAIDDVLGLIAWAAAGDVSGPVNLTAPEPVTNAELTRTLGRVLGRPTLLPLPAFAVKLVFGEMGERLLLEGQRVLPKVALEGGYRFQFPRLEDALHFELGE